MKKKEDIYDFQISFRFVNITVDKRIDIDDDIYLHPVSGLDVIKKYPINEIMPGMSELVKRGWARHNLEVVFKFKGNKDDIDKSIMMGNIDYLEKTISSAFLFSGISDNNPTYATDASLSSPIRNVNIKMGGISGFIYYPPLASESDICVLKKSYNIIKSANEDRVFKTSIDRYLLAKKQGAQHLNKINQPNWDKIVDYVIAFETILLTHSMAELTYRFKLNGSTLISKIDNIEKRKIFDALSELYKLRSKIIHGENEDKIINHAKKIVELLDIDDVHHQHDIGILILISNKLNHWFYKIYEYLSELDVDDRPYSKKGIIWEEWLWE